MKVKALFALVALSLSGASVVQAQDYDNRWYAAPYIGAYHNDDDRFTDDMSVLFGMGVGHYIAPNSSIDIFLDRTSRSTELPPETGTWSNTMLGVSLRHYFGSSDSWQPYVMAGAGVSNHRNTGADDGYDFAFQAGGGVSRAFTDNVRFRGELAYRYDLDDESLPGFDNYGDIMLNLGVTIAIGDAGEPAEPREADPEAPAQPAQPQTDCHTLDDDKDGVNNCDDRCPATEAGKLVGPDGCPQKVVIDLRGVNFDFDKSNLRPDAVELLDQAVDTLKRYPDIKCEVAGHTDSIGSDEYNQGLSERRARAVWDYLTGHGIDAGRLSGPNGYGESRPIAPNTNDDGSDNPEGRARNRRTELVVE